ncbi:uncharacterized protein AB675_5590 [Cyphellophora attinorum]|uniref:BRCT domain-containing protein n=1 Tax=Cyphellophora attinorum TaxID=1664694 RepID=A0A0N1HW95_9EURO|nr:uncharacterized protein AB675_5590 [Phialophora attinorum]KPI41832.1 hypothetical protein AB675_5590 [Phialophora attinorum]
MERIGTDSISTDEVARMKRQLLHGPKPSEQGSIRSPTAFRRDLLKPEAARAEQSESLPSTVPESLDVARVPQPLARMSAPEVAADATQEISQEGIHAITRSRSKVETQATWQAGDTGAVDFSSWNPAGDSEPVAYSPTQRTQRHTQFPESQRFLQTPATAGRKRPHDGSSASVAKRPQLRSKSQDTPVGMGISQAFEATQAQTSPLDQVEPRSDRPSPEINVEHRPVGSSPLQRLPSSSVRPRSADPAPRYVSMRHSQAFRAQKQQEELAAEDSDSDSGESFLNGSKKKRRRSAGNTPPAADVEGWLRSTQASPIASPPIQAEEDLIEDRDSEAETEQEDDEAVVQRFSQRMALEPEDKENYVATLVPQTTMRPVRPLDEVAEVVQASPSLRQHRPPTAPNSSGSVAVENSQPSQPVPISQRPVKSSSISVLTLFRSLRRAVPPVPSPPDSQNGEADDKQGEEDRRSLDGNQVEDQPEIEEEAVEAVITEADQHASKPSTIAETDSARRKAQLSDTNASKQPASTTPFETAPTGLEPPATDTRTPRTKRKRIDETEELTTPSRTGMTQSQEFNAAEALLGSQMQIPSDDSPLRPRKRYRGTGPSLEIPETVSTSVKPMMPSSDSNADDGDELLKSQPAVQPRRIAPQTLQRDGTWDVQVTPSPQAPVRPVSVQKPEVVTEKRSTRPRKLTEKAKANAAQVVARKMHATGREVSVEREAAPPTPQQTPKSSSVVPQREQSVESTSTPATYRTAPAGEIVAPNAVFACFNGKSRAYFPARCLGKSNDGQKFTVQWPEFDPDDVDIYGVRRLELRIGDQVKVNMEGVQKVTYVVRGLKGQVSDSDVMTDQYGYSSVVIAPKQRKSLPAGVSTDSVREVPIANIYLDSNMWNQMKDRDFHYTTTGITTPAGELSSTPTSPASRQRRQNLAVDIPIAATAPKTEGLLAGLVFAISYDDEVRRKELIQMLKTNGAGIVNDSFSELFEPDSTTLRASFAGAGFTALLADKHSRKPKYLQALALGFPCLSGRWIEACLAQGKLLDWRKWLLPAGECEQLEGAVRSRLLPPMAVGEAELEDILAQRDQVLAGKKVMVIMGKGSKMRNYLFFMHAMGAVSVETIVDAKAAKECLDGGQAADIVYVEEEKLEAAEVVLKSSSEATVVSSGNRRGRKSKAAAAAVAAPSWKLLGTESLVQSLVLGELVS